MLQKLGDSYYFKADLDNAAKWYGELFAFTQDVSPEYYYRYSQSLKAVKDYKKADEMLAKFNQKSGNDSRAKLANSQKDYLAQIKKKFRDAIPSKTLESTRNTLIMEVLILVTK